jgi:hypothetical protein
MSKRWFLITLTMVIMLVCMGCGKGETIAKPNLTTKQIEEFYPGDISKVDHIEIRNGTTGELRVVTDKQVVQDWVSTIRHVKLTPDPNQEPRAGYLFAVGLFEGTEKKLGFLPDGIAGNYYLYSKELEKLISDLFEKK